jgi:protein-S-isoprenylcysteine O-methyltransferase Ste14
VTTWAGLIVVTAVVIWNLFHGIAPRDIGNVPWGVAGAVIVLLGVGLRSWSAGIIHKTETLTTVGPYALVRHPLYIGSLLIAVGFCILVVTPIEAAVILGVLVSFHVRKARREERKLSAKYGEVWQEYAKRTGAFHPKQAPAGVFARWSLSQWAHNKEFGALLTGIIALAVIEYWHKNPGLGQHLRAYLG